jgi:Predicted metal-dependent hydrolase
MKVDIINNYHISIKELDLKERGRLKSQIKLVLESLDLPEKSEVCITFVDDVTMSNLNKTYRGIDKVTDVLSFPQDVEDLVKLNSAIANSRKT